MATTKTAYIYDALHILLLKRLLADALQGEKCASPTMMLPRYYNTKEQVQQQAMHGPTQLPSSSPSL
jgi:hypothetical protein